MDSLIQVLVLGLSLVGFAFIIFEEKLSLEKFKSALFFGAFAWIFILVDAHLAGKEVFHLAENEFNHVILEVAMLWLFLISAMTFVAYLDKRGFISLFVLKKLPTQMTDKNFMFLLGGFTFLISGVADNLTATLVALTIMLKVMEKSNITSKIKVSVYVIFAANAGGLPLITGDITTLMIFIAGKIQMFDLLKLYVPAVISTLILFFFLSKGMDEKKVLVRDNSQINELDKKIAIIFGFTIIAILLGHVLFHLPPVLTFLAGLSLMFIIIAHEKIKSKSEMNVLDYIRHIEFDALFFFLGVLMLVGAVKEVGLLKEVAGLYNIVDKNVASFLIGIVSAVVDNIPITAAMLKAELPLNEKEWMLLTYAVGVGGSLLAIGSAAGVVAMSKVKELTFGSYLRYTPYVFVAYLVGFIITYFIAWLLILSNLKSFINLGDFLFILLIKKFLIYS